ncbi:hypothetical protein [Ruegeria sp. TM1040]|uniref:hypothetical protein n=1 Tax=Ruegeria sp. (strain TM1040) TaxID=292414 RepID=UPI000046237B|nr:hypothetical protein [Ruegeria sp. TM1040]
MTPAERFEKLSDDYPMPWQLVCQYVAGDYIPERILDRDGNKVMDCKWGAATEAGKHLYACLVEASHDRVKFGNPWNCMDANQIRALTAKFEHS